MQKTVITHLPSGQRLVVDGTLPTHSGIGRTLAMAMMKSWILIHLPGDQPMEDSDFQFEEVADA